jgi:selenide,water dikinase
MDDAGVYALNEETALVQTVDVLTPIADEPDIFGEIAAANSLSDVYAMGATPVVALNIVGFPGGLDVEILGEMLRGGAEKAEEAGTAIIGGHTIKDEELKYGLAVTGLVETSKIIGNDGAKPGDRLILTKPLGTGVAVTALKAGLASKETIKKVNDSMRQLNAEASRTMQEIGVNACTDITGFGLLGHALEMASASGVSFSIHSDRVPIFDEVREYASKGLFPGGSESNLKWVELFIETRPTIDPSLLMLLCDAQTSGGLLISIEKEKADGLVELLRKKGVGEAEVIGEVKDTRPTGITII